MLGLHFFSPVPVMRLVEVVVSIASREDIDEGMVLGCGHPMGPLTLCDFVGLDVLYAVAQSLYEEFKKPDYAPPPLLKRMVAAGHFGRKTGRGFYVYDGEGARRGDA